MTETRRHLGELELRLRDRIRRLDEPVSRQDWADVLARSDELHAHGPRVRAAVFAAAAVAALAAAAFTFAPWTSGSARAAAPSRLAIHLSDGRQLVLFGRADNAIFVNETDDREVDSRISPAVWRTLAQAGPFRVVASPSTKAVGAKGLHPGDRALFALDLYTSAQLKHGAGSGTLSCSYLAGRNAICEGTVALSDGSRFSASGYLDPSTSSVSLSATVSGSFPQSA